MSVFVNGVIQGRPRRTGAHVIVLGNEKGGSGKTTTAMHVATALMAQGRTVGAMDLDLRQRSFTRYMENRLAFAERRGLKLAMPRYAKVKASDLPERAAAEAEETEAVRAAIGRLSDCDYVVIDSPGSYTAASRAAHALADTIVTPINDSFVDFDLLAHVDPDTLQIVGPSLYAEMVWDARKVRAIEDGGNIDWIVMRNRMAHVNAKNKERVGALLKKLAKRIGFRTAPGFSERVIYRELFLNGLTLLDLNESGGGLNMSHVAARQEVRNLIAALELPAREVPAEAAE
ncbi:MAG: division plane positioning ATPase MipZ [Alphaproteobacteria bacterium]|nr:division plane positioning ATPase MipZ [Alphaproteobacteria bacterium]MDX5367780.1 division plane positioning ATPase MipZ [Alphaproteobacteria bacterium]MDX5462663.1 division plane positioning ATPase MipZ [Alphaproteobacteria bacterium]